MRISGLINIVFFLSLGYGQALSQAGFAKHFDDEAQGDNAASIINVFKNHLITAGYQRVYITDNSYSYQYQRLVIDKTGELIDDQGYYDVWEVVDVQKKGNQTLELLYSKNFLHPLIRVRESIGNTVFEKIIIPQNTYYDFSLANKLYLTEGYIYLLARGINLVEYERSNYEVVGLIYKMDYDLNVIDQEVYHWPTKYVAFRDIVGVDGGLFVLFEQKRANSSAYNYCIGRLYEDWSVDVIYQSDKKVFLRETGATNLIQLDNGNLVFVDYNEMPSGHDDLDQITCISPQGEVIWKYDYTEGNLFSSYRHKIDIQKIVLSPSGKIIVAGKDFGDRLFDSHRESAFLMQLDQEGNREWLKRFNYLPGESEYWTQGDTILPVETVFRDVKVDDDGSIFAAGLAKVTVKRVGPDNSLRNNADVFLVKTDSMGCILPGCEEEQFIGGTTMPATTVVPERRWTERTTTGNGLYADTTYRFAPDSIYEEGRYYVPIERFDPVSGAYLSTGNAMREIQGKMFLRRNSFDYMVGEKDLYVGDRLWSTFTFPGNAPVQRIEQEVVFRDTFTTLDGLERIRLTYECTESHGLPDYGTYEWIEGIGRLDGRLSVFRACIASRNTEVLCMYQGEQKIYQSPNYEDCGIISSTNQPDYRLALQIVPNPTSEFVNVVGLEKDAQMSLFSMSGQFLSSTYGKSISLAGFKQGSYLLRIITDNGFTTKKIVKM